MDELTCENCKYFVTSGALYSPINRCHRYPPYLVDWEFHNGITVDWPVVAPDAWCGEFVEKGTYTLADDSGPSVGARSDQFS